MNSYKQFHELHFQEHPLLLANAWNARSAQLIEAAGFQAMGTSSGAIASSLGYEDGEKIPFEDMLYIVRRIRAVTNIPLSVDIERGYSDELNILIDNIQKLIDSGVSGINIEDAQGEDIYLRKLACISEYLVKTGQQLFINARVDTFLQKLPSPLETTIERAQRYERAGANGLFVTAVPDVATVKEITAATTLPVNIVATPKMTVSDLASAGVRRISMAVIPYRATYGHMEKVMGQIIAERSLSSLF